MKVYLKNIVITLYMLSIPLLLNAQSPGAAFLKIAPDARTASLGGACMASDFTSSAIWWNPAVLAYAPRPELAGTHALWGSGMQYESLCYAQPLTERTIAASFVMLDVGSIEGRDEQGNRNGDFSARDYAFSCAYSKMFTNSISAGCSMKIIRQEIEEEAATGWAIDIGCLMPLTNRGLNLGLGLFNVGPNISFLSERYPLPTTAGIGIGYTLSGILLVGDIKYDYHNEKVEYLAGVEYSMMNVLSFRLGCLYNSLGRAMSSIGNDSLGIQRFGMRGGFGLKMAGYRLDYAYLPLGELGITHQISFSTSF